MLKDTVVDYLDNSSFHGLRFLTESGRHWIERLLWLGCILGSWYLCFTLMVASYTSFIDNPMSFGVETDYINWNTSFFSVAVCEQRNRPPVFALGKEMYGAKHDFNLDEILLEMTYFKGDHYFTKNFCGGGQKTLDCPKGDFRKLSLDVRTDCAGMFHKCLWNDTTYHPAHYFNCCQYFQLIDTEKGPCFALNSLLTEKKNVTLDLTCNKDTGPAKLHLELKVPADVHILGPEEVPFYNAHLQTVISAQRSIYKARQYTVTEIINDPAVPSLNIDQRQCRFGYENPLKNFKYYSFMACVVECREEKQLQLCGCVSHLSPGVDKSKHCDLKGLLCLIDNYNNYSVLVNPWTSGAGLSCQQCLTSCTEPEINLVEERDSGFPNNYNVGVVEIGLQRLPTLRLKRTVVKGTLDLVVSLGGSAGLFVGASLLSFVELIYFCTVRPIWNYRTKKSLKSRSS